MLKVANRPVLNRTVQVLGHLSGVQLQVQTGRLMSGFDTYFLEMTFKLRYKYKVLYLCPRVVLGSIPGWSPTFRRTPNVVRKTGESRE